MPTCIFGWKNFYVQDNIAQFYSEDGHRSSSLKSERREPAASNEESEHNSRNSLLRQKNTIVIITKHKGTGMVNRLNDKLEKFRLNFSRCANNDIITSLTAARQAFAFEAGLEENQCLLQLRLLYVYFISFLHPWTEKKN